MPAWPGLLLIIGGGLLAVGALVAFELDRRGTISADLITLGLGLLLGAIAFVAGLIYAAMRQIGVRRALPPERYRGPSVFILLALALVIGTVLTAPFTADALVLSTGEGELSLLGSAVILIATQAGLLIVAYLLVRRPQALAALPAFPGPHPLRSMVAGLGWGVLAWIGSQVLLVVLTALLTALGQAPPVTPAVRAIATLDPWLLVVAIVVFAPIAEELFFRGVVFNAWRREAGRRWAYLGSAALFAAIHVSLVSLVPIFLLGLALAWAYERTRTLLVPIVMHATVNGISVLIALIIRFSGVELPV